MELAIVHFTQKFGNVIFSDTKIHLLQAIYQQRLHKKQYDHLFFIQNKVIINKLKHILFMQSIFTTLNPVQFEWGNSYDWNGKS